MRIVAFIWIFSFYTLYGNIPDRCKVKGFDRPEWGKSNVVSVIEPVVNKDNTIILSPNPVTDYLKITLFGIEDYSANISITNLLGQSVLSIYGIQIINGKLTHEIDNELKNLMPGLYFISVFSELTYQSTVFIKF